MDHPFYSDAYRAFQAAVAAADPGSAVKRHMPTFDTAPLVISVGKAAVKMAVAARECLGALDGAIVVTNPENATEVAGATVFAAAHPVPDDVGVQAGQAVVAALAAAAPGRPVLCLISGGGSALLPAPTAPVTLADKASLNGLLLASGADIVTMNMIRQQVSNLKGGGILRHAQGPVTALILSDVIGDDLRAIASGPTVGPLGTRADAMAALRDMGVWADVPQSVADVLQNHPTQPVGPAAKNVLVGSNAISVAAMAQALAQATHHQTALEGNVADAVHWVADLAPGTHVFGGETTVTLTGTGTGGRNQDLALRVALAAERSGWSGPWLYLQAGTDGRDGPTDAAGGCVTQDTLSAIRQAGIDPQAALDNNDAYPALKAGGALLMTGGTGTNVADVGVLIRT
ncbi:MAG: DUF4147 domain-containing protein [Pseudomonadota bacterium]